MLGLMLLVILCLLTQANKEMDQDTPASNGEDKVGPRIKVLRFACYTLNMDPLITDKTKPLVPVNNQPCFLILVLAPHASVFFGLAGIILKVLS